MTTVKINGKLGSNASVAIEELTGKLGARGRVRRSGRRDGGDRMSAPTAQARRANHRRQREAEYRAWLDYRNAFYAHAGMDVYGPHINLRPMFRLWLRDMGRRRLRRVLGTRTPYERKNGYPRSRR